jgi:hypothetical protein
MAEERIIPRRAERGLGFAPSITPSPLVQASQLMAPPAPAAPLPPESNELLQVAESLKGLNSQLASFGLTYLRNEAVEARQEGEADANSDPEKARQVLRMGFQNAVKAGVLKESSNPMYWKSYMENTAKNIVAPGFQEYLHQNWMGKMSDPKNTEPIESIQAQAWAEYQKKSGFNLDSVFAKAAANEVAATTFKSFSTSALNRRLEQREIDARNQLGISIQRGFKSAEALPSEEQTQAVVGSFIAAVGEAASSGMSNPTYYAIKTGVMPYIDELRRSNPDKALSVIDSIKNTKLPNGYIVGEGNTLELFNNMEEAVIRTMQTEEGAALQERGNVLTAAQDRAYILIDQYKNINDPNAINDITSALIAANVPLPDGSGNFVQTPLSTKTDLHGVIGNTVRKLVEERRNLNAQPNSEHMTRFQTAIVNNDIAEANRLYDLGQESGFNGTNQAKMLEALQSLKSYEPLLKSQSSAEARAAVKSSIAIEFDDRPAVANTLDGLVDLEFNKAVKVEMDAYLAGNPGMTQDKAAPIVMNNVRERVVKTLQDYGNKQIKAIDIEEKRNAEVRAKAEAAQDTDKSLAGPGWLNFDEVSQVQTYRNRIRNIVELARASKMGIAPDRADIIKRDLARLDAKVDKVVARTAEEVRKKTETKLLAPSSDLIMDVRTYDVPKSTAKMEADKYRYWTAKASKGYTPAEIFYGQTDENIEIDPNLNPLVTPVFTSVEELASFRIAYRNGDERARKIMENLSIRDVPQFFQAQALAVESLGRGRGL